MDFIADNVPRQQRDCSKSQSEKRSPEGPVHFRFPCDWPVALVSFSELSQAPRRPRAVSGQPVWHSSAEGLETLCSLSPKSGLLTSSKSSSSSRRVRTFSDMAEAAAPALPTQERETLVTQQFSLAPEPSMKGILCITMNTPGNEFPSQH